MRKRIDGSKIKVVIMNPEAIPAAQEKLIKCVYEDYIKSHIEIGSIETGIKRIEDGNM